MMERTGGREGEKKRGRETQRERGKVEGNMQDECRVASPVGHLEAIKSPPDPSITPSPANTTHLPALIPAPEHLRSCQVMRRWQ